MQTHLTLRDSGTKTTSITPCPGDVLTNSRLVGWWLFRAAVCWTSPFLIKIKVSHIFFFLFLIYHGVSKDDCVCSYTMDTTKFNNCLVWYSDLVLSDIQIWSCLIFIRIRSCLICGFYCGTEYTLLMLSCAFLLVQTVKRNEQQYGIPLKIVSYEVRKLFVYPCCSNKVSSVNI